MKRDWIKDVVPYQIVPLHPHPSRAYQTHSREILTDLGLDLATPSNGYDLGSIVNSLSSRKKMK